MSSRTPSLPGETGTDETSHALTTIRPEGDAETTGPSGAKETEESEVISPEYKAYLQRRLLTDLRRAADAEAKMSILADFLDRYGFDALIGAIPHIGDGAITSFAVLVTLWQGLKSGISFKTGLKIGAFHLVDFLISQIPVFGDLIDLFIKPNNYAAGEIAHRLRILLDEARAKGVPEEEIEAVLEGAGGYKERWGERFQTLEKIRGKIFKTLGIEDKRARESGEGRGESHAEGRGGDHAEKPGGP